MALSTVAKYILPDTVNLTSLICYSLKRNHEKLENLDNQNLKATIIPIL